MQPSCRQPQIAAIFDVDRTLLRYPSERLFFCYLLQQRVLPLRQGLLFLAALLQQYPDRHGNKSYLQGLACAQVQQLAEDCYHSLLKPRLSAAALACLQGHQRQGHQTVLLSGSLEYLLRPLHRDLQTHWLIATRLEVNGRQCTGRIQGRHPRGLNKVLLLQELAVQAGFVLSQSFAYADDASDLPLLEQVGHPVAVNPSRPLKLLAQQRGWPIRRFR